MPFTENWVETDPDGSIITGSLLDDWTRKTKVAVRERMEGDPAFNLTGIAETGTWATGPTPKAGSARMQILTAATLGTALAQDGRIAFTSDTKRLYHTALAGTVEIGYPPISGFTGALDLTGATVVLNGTPTKTIVRGTTADSSIQLQGVAASGRKNWLITKDWTVADNFEIVPSTVVDGITYTTPALKLTPAGALTVATITGTILTAAQANITSVGVLTALVISAGVHVGTQIALATAGTDATRQSTWSIVAGESVIQTYDYTAVAYLPFRGDSLNYKWQISGVTQMEFDTASRLLIATTNVADTVSGEIVLGNNKSLRGVNLAGTSCKPLIRLSANDIIELGGGFTGGTYTQHRGMTAAALAGGNAAADGIIVLDTTNNRLVYYSGTNRYWLFGTAF